MVSATLLAAVNGTDYASDEPATPAAEATGTLVLADGTMLGTRTLAGGVEGRGG
jgi:hypothetical protein